jgi:hypothetical protein|tara:strand:+ start:1320 stop:1694 length:375 start_codon:yes stop_codon:yes gene_type:complete
MSYFIGTSPEAVVNGFIKRYFYGLRRNDDGELFLIRIDQLAGEETAVINDVGIGENNFLDYEEGIDFLEGVDIDHNVIYQNLRYPQLKWDSRLLTYYVDPVDGQYIISISQDYEYPENISSPGY